MTRRNPSIELYRCLLMLGICMCHSVGAGVHPYDPVRNICMMCTVGFIFITGWFGVSLSLKRVVKVLGIALFALGVTVCEDYFLHGKITVAPHIRFCQWWFLNDYIALMGLSPLLNCIVNCVTSPEAKTRREALFATAIIAFAVFGIAWPMQSSWLPGVRFFLTFGHRTGFGMMCAIYLIARVINQTRLYEKINGYVCLAMFVFSCGLATLSMNFSNYNSPVALIFAIASFYPFLKYELKDSAFSRAVVTIAPSMFFVYLYHTHSDVGFVLIHRFQSWILGLGVPVVGGWIVTAIVIFVVGVLLDSMRRGLVHRVLRLRK